jgi:hypothetical protein
VKFPTKSTWFEFQRREDLNRVLELDIPTFKATYTKLSGPWALRRNAGSGGGKFIVFTQPAKLKAFLDLNPQCSTEAGYFASEKAPDDAIIVQGNLMGNLAELTFAHDAMGTLSRSSDPKDWFWPQYSLLQLRVILGESYYERLMDLYEAVIDGPTHIPVIEFSLYSKPVGIHRERMIIWEIRDY